MTQSLLSRNKGAVCRHSSWCRLYVSSAGITTASQWRSSRSCSPRLSLKWVQTKASAAPALSQSTKRNCSRGGATSRRGRSDCLSGSPKASLAVDKASVVRWVLLTTLASLRSGKFSRTRPVTRPMSGVLSKSSRSPTIASVAPVDRPKEGKLVNSKP